MKLIVKSIVRTYQLYWVSRGFLNMFSLLCFFFFFFSSSIKGKDWMVM